jgi:hypothetical protein
MRRFVQSQAPSTQHGMEYTRPIPANKSISSRHCPCRLSSQPSPAMVVGDSLIRLPPPPRKKYTNQEKLAFPIAPKHPNPLNRSCAPLLWNPAKPERFPVFVGEAFQFPPQQYAETRLRLWYILPLYELPGAELQTLAGEAPPYPYP